MSNTQTEELRRSAHNVAEVLYEGEVGGECYHGERHKCFTVQGRKPLALYKVEEMCERCAAAWHAAMTATLLDALVISQRFLNGASEVPRAGRTAPIEIEFEAASAKRKPGRPKKAKGTAVVSSAYREDHHEVSVSSVKPNIDGKYGVYTDEQKAQILVNYAQVAKKPEKIAFLAKYGLKAWHLSGWRNRTKSLKGLKTKGVTKTPKTKAAKSVKRAKTDEDAFPCNKCGKVFFRKNSKTMHERFCKEAL